MNCLGRNKSTISYANYLSQTPKTDSEGNYTGEYEQTYSAVATEKLYVTAAQGSASERMFGESVDYDKVLIGTKTSIKEHAKLWLGISTSLPYNYKVEKVAQSLNQVSIAIKKVETK